MLIEDVNLGRLAEKHFSGWCTLIGLAATEPDPDEFGWDFFIEFGEDFDPARALDNQNELRKALVQVKATQTASTSVRAKLSALRRLILTDLPAFIIHMEYGDDLQAPVRTRLLHIGLTEMEEILRKVRETEQEGTSRLNEVRLNLSLSHSIEIEYNQPALRAALLAAMPQGATAYGAQKSRDRATCGFDENSVVGRFSLGDGFDESAMVDLLLGYVTDLPINQMVIERSRFGLALDKDTTRIAEGRLSVELTPSHQGRISIVTDGMKRSPALPVNVFVAALSDLAPENQRVRLTNEFINLELFLGLGNANYRFTLDPDARMPIEALADYVKFAVAMSEPGASLEYEIDNKASSLTELPDDLESYGRFRPVSEFLDVVATAVFRFHRHKPIETSLREMVDSMESCRTWYQAMSRGGLVVRQRFEAEIQIPHEKFVIFPVWIPMGDVAYWAIAKSKASSTFDGEIIRLVADKPVLLGEGIVLNTDEHLEQLNVRTEAAGQQSRASERLIVTVSIARTTTDPQLPNP